MTDDSESPMDRLWSEYGSLFYEFDDLTLARWMSQTLGQIEGRAWRLSHPLLSAYRLAAQVGHDRQIWFKRLVSHPSAYPVAECCRAPVLPLFTRDIVDTGLICQHCSETVVPFGDLPKELQASIRAWSEQYKIQHEVAHWDPQQQELVEDYDETCEEAAEVVETLLVQAATELVPQILELYPAVIWEDQDECLEVRPEDLELPR